MANVIKHKRGSGSDPVASDLVVGEVAIRTDVGKLFTKMDNGSVAEIAGGGSDIAINTLSSSSATGGGSATFNGSAYRFTLSAPPSVSAQQLLVSINGVIQKPVAGTGQPSEGFSVDGTDIILGDAPATGSDFFILTFKSLGVSEPADNSVTSAKIVDGAIVNADINASAAIDVSKLSGVLPLAGGTLIGNLAITREQPIISFNDSTDNPDYYIGNIDGSFRIRDTTNSSNRLVIDASGRLGIGITSPDTELHVKGVGSILKLETTATTGSNYIDFNDADENKAFIGLGSGSDDSLSIWLRKNTNMRFATNNTEKVRIDGSGNVGIGTLSPSAKLHVLEDIYAKGSTGDGSVGIQIRSGGSALSNQHQIRTGGGLGQQIFIEALGSDSAVVTKVNGSERMRLDSSGRVGIAQTPVSEKLEVSGAIRSTSASANFAAGAEAVFMDFIPGNRGRIGTITGTGSARDLAFNIGNLEKMRIDTNGNVGIGTTSPARGPLHVHENSSSDCQIHLTNNDTGSTSGDGLTIFTDTDTSGIWSREDVDFRIATNGTERLRIRSNGKVLIGTTSPQNNANADDLVVATGGNTGITIRSGTQHNGNIFFADGVTGSDESRGVVGYDHDDNSMSFSTNTAERMRIDSSGNVGIGTTSPSQKLDVSGGIKATTDITLASTTTGQSIIVTKNGTQAVKLGHIGTGNEGLLVLKENGTDTVKFNGATGGTSYINAGNVGIKTTSPIGTLNVHDGTFVLSKPSTNSASRNWRFLPDNIAAGNLGLQVSTAAGGSTFQNVLEVDKTGTIFTAQNGTAFSWGSNPGHVWYADGEARSTTANGVHYRINRMNGDGHAMQFYRGQTSLVGFISITSTGTSYGSGSSDERTKKNIEDWSESVLNKFKSLTPKLFNFNWEDDTDAKHKGYIAQNEVDKFPEAYPKNNLSDTEDEFYTFTPTDMTVYLMKGLKEAAEKIETLEAKVEALEAT